MIDWPDIKFPPVNLHSAPHLRNWPHQYLKLEREYIGDLMQEFYDAEDNKKDIIAARIEEKREEFNRLWNVRSKEG